MEGQVVNKSKVSELVPTWRVVRVILASPIRRTPGRMVGVHVRGSTPRGWRRQGPITYTSSVRIWTPRALGHFCLGKS